MKTDKIRKFLLSNIPYLFIGWAILKISTAYRMAAGADFLTKAMGIGQTIAPAFADLAPGLNPVDWLVGIVGAVGFRLLIYMKSKKAKKFRRDEEYGSARWGNEKDIKPFSDPKFENNVILTGTEFLTMNTRPKVPANARNLNCCIIGSSGSGKTRFWLTPQLLQAHSSYVCVDPKGGVLNQVGGFLQKRGYKIKVFNSIDFSKSMHYNPMAYIKNEADILKFVDTLIANTKGDGKEGDPFWTKAETLLYCALIAYIIFEGAPADRNMNTLVDMISGMEVKEDDEDFLNPVDYMFIGLEKRKPDCFAVKQYKKYKLASGVVCSKRLLNQAVGKSLRTHNLKPKKGAQVMRKNEKITALYERLSRDDFGKDDDQQRESNSISNQKAMLGSLYGDIKKEEQSLKEASRKASRRKTSMEQELKNLKGEKMRMYEEYAAGTLSLDNYKNKKQEYDRKIAEVQDKIEQSKAEEAAQSVVPGTVRAAAEQAENFLHGTRLTASMVSAFIENVYVHEGGRIVVQFKYEQSIQDAVRALHTD